MKTTRLFVILTVLFVDTAFSHPDAPSSSLSLPSDIIQQGDRALAIRELSPLADSKELIARIDPDSKTAVALKFATRAGMTTVLGIGLYAIQKDCREFSEDNTFKNSVVCLGGSVGTAVAVASELARSHAFYWELTRSFTLTAIDWTIGTAVRRYTGGDIAMLGPFVRAGAIGQPVPPAGGGRRSINHRPYKRAEDHFSARFGVEVRQIGQWDGAKRRNSTGVWKRDDQEGVIPTFGLRYRANDLHFAFHGETLEGHKRIKIGFGPGPETEENTRRLEARGELEDEIERIKLSFQYNKYYFDQGGLDMVVDADTDNGQASEIELPQMPGLFGPDEHYIPFPGENDNSELIEQVRAI